MKSHSAIEDQVRAQRLARVTRGGPPCCGTTDVLHRWWCTASWPHLREQFPGERSHD